MTELLFLKDSYIKEFTANVTGHVDGGIILDRTAFYIGAEANLATKECFWRMGWNIR